MRSLKSSDTVIPARAVSDKRKVMNERILAKGQSTMSGSTPSSKNSKIGEHGYINKSPLVNPERKEVGIALQDSEAGQNNDLLFYL